MKEVPINKKPLYYNIYKDTPKKDFTSFHTESEARITAWYLNDQFNIARDYGVSVQENKEMKKKENYKSAWLLMLPEEAVKYKTSIDNMITAMSDFWNAWRACKKYFEITEKE